LVDRSRVPLCCRGPLPFPLGPDGSFQLTASRQRRRGSNLGGCRTLRRPGTGPTTTQRRP
jgi:hypothetical protein